MFWPGAYATSPTRCNGRPRPRTRPRIGSFWRCKSRFIDLESTVVNCTTARTLRHFTCQITGNIIRGARCSVAALWALRSPAAKPHRPTKHSAQFIVPFWRFDVVATSRPTNTGVRIIITRCSLLLAAAASEKTRQWWANHVKQLANRVIAPSLQLPSKIVVLQISYCHSLSFPNSYAIHFNYIISHNYIMHK